ncbi:MAG: YbhB/YbcL family Raf kinase inhibitor-like protein [Brucella anthropi]
MKKTLIAAAAVMAAMATPALSADLGVSFQWGPTKKCFDSKSPPFNITGVPKETKTLTFRMVDRNAMGFEHGGGKVAFNGKAAIPYGAFRYKGPCPPSGSHNYSWTVKALDAGGKTLAEGKAAKMFP